jgi:hypothetical protein
MVSYTTLTSKILENLTSKQIYEEKLTISFVHSSLATYCRERSPNVYDKILVPFGITAELIHLMK